MSKHSGGIFTYQLILNIHCRYVDDETSPLFCDPLHSEDYTYSILSKALAKKQPTQVASAANQVQGAEGVSTTAHKAVHEETWKGSGASRRSTAASQSGTEGAVKGGSRVASPGTDGGVVVGKERGEGEEAEENTEDCGVQRQRHEKAAADCAV